MATIRYTKKGREILGDPKTAPTSTTAAGSDPEPVEKPVPVEKPKGKAAQ